MQHHSPYRRRRHPSPLTVSNSGVFENIPTQDGAAHLSWLLRRVPSRSRRSSTKRPQRASSSRSCASDPPASCWAAAVLRVCPPWRDQWRGRCPARRLGALVRGARSERELSRAKGETTPRRGQPDRAARGRHPVRSALLDARACPEAQLAHLRLLGERLRLSPRLSPRFAPTTGCAASRSARRSSILRPVAAAAAAVQAAAAAAGTAAGTAADAAAATMAAGGGRWRWVEECVPRFRRARWRSTALGRGRSSRADVAHGHMSAHEDAVLACGAGGAELGTFRGDGEGVDLAGGRMGGQREGERRPEQGRRGRSRWSRWSRWSRRRSGRRSGRRPVCAGRARFTRRRSFANGPAAARGARHGARGARYGVRLPPPPRLRPMCSRRRSARSSPTFGWHRSR
jgi:hypothetical protein